MRSISIDSSDDRFIISIDKKLISKELLIQFVDNLRIEFLAGKVDFGEDIEDLGEEILMTWWSENIDRFIPQEEQ